MDGESLRVCLPLERASQCRLKSLSSLHPQGLAHRKCSSHGLRGRARRRQPAQEVGSANYVQKPRVKEGWRLELERDRWSGAQLICLESGDLS